MCQYIVLHALMVKEKIVQPVTNILLKTKLIHKTFSVELDSNLNLCSKKSAKFSLSWFSTHSHLMNLIKANIPI